MQEWRYTREIAIAVVGRLRGQGYDAERIVPEDADISLGQRCARVNSYCDQMGYNKVLFVSIHCNAAGADGQWKAARGWEAWTSPGQTRGDVLAEYLYDAAKKYLPAGTPVRTDKSDGDRDKEAKFTVLTHTKCAAVLTENLFQDNKADVDYLLSPAGREAIINLHVEGIKNYINAMRK